MRVGKRKPKASEAGIYNVKENRESKDIETLKKSGDERFMKLGAAPLER
jgi:hypothetical protein